MLDAAPGHSCSSPVSHTALYPGKLRETVGHSGQILGLEEQRIQCPTQWGVAKIRVEGGHTGVRINQ